MVKEQRTLLITGATGFIGSYLVDRVKNIYNIYALSRRRPKNEIFFNNPNIKWIQADIGEEKSLNQALNNISPEYPVDFVIHLASFYDFNYDNNPEYYRTNEVGTKNILDASKKMKIERFLFASSVAACEFPRTDGQRITEKTPADASFAYAVSKRKGEEMVRQYSKHFPCSVIRFAAAYSDWCEYGPLYMFLDTWLKPNWKSRILGGKGKSAIPYIHIECLINLLLELVNDTERFPAFDTYIASSSHSNSHEELFELATKFFFGKSRRPFHMPKYISFFGLIALDILGRFTGNRPFERPWMIKYVDKQLLIDNSYTLNALKWRPTKRYMVNRRLLFLIENMKSYPFEWQKRNYLALKKFKVSPNFLIYEALDNLKDTIIDKCLKHLLHPENYERFKGYHTIDKHVLRKDTVTLFQFLTVAVRAKDRMSIIAYAKEIAYIRHKQNFDPREVLHAVNDIGEIVYKELISQPNLKGMEQAIYDEIKLVFQLVVDEIEGTFETIYRAKTSLAQYVFSIYDEANMVQKKAGSD